MFGLVVHSALVNAVSQLISFLICALLPIRDWPFPIDPMTSWLSTPRPPKALKGCYMQKSFSDHDGEERWELVALMFPEVDGFSQDERFSVSFPPFLHWCLFRANTSSPEGEKNTEVI